MLNFQFEMSMMKRAPSRMIVENASIFKVTRLFKNYEQNYLLNKINLFFLFVFLAFLASSSDLL